MEKGPEYEQAIFHVTTPLLMECAILLERGGNPEIAEEIGRLCVLLQRKINPELTDDNAVTEMGWVLRDMIVRFHSLRRRLARAPTPDAATDSDDPEEPEEPDDEEVKNGAGCRQQ